MAGEGGSGSLDNIGDNRSNERIRDTRISEEGGTVVKDEVDLSNVAGSGRAGVVKERLRTPLSC